MKKFKLNSPYKPLGDQPKAINSLVDGINKGEKEQTLLGVTGSGKTFTMANVIEKVQKPTLVISHNKTLAAQLYEEFKEFFPDNAVEYFVSYYDYYQPEAYVPRTDTFIDKESSVNEEIDIMRHSATQSLLSRDDVIVVSSVSCIYGVGSPEDYGEFAFGIAVGDNYDRSDIIRKLVFMQYERNDIEFARGHFRVRGDVIEINPVHGTPPVRVELFGDEIDAISLIDKVTGKKTESLKRYMIFPAKHFVVGQDKMDTAIRNISDELDERLNEFNLSNKLLEAQRLEQRTRFDIEMLQEMGYCPGVENYSMHLSGKTNPSYVPALDPGLLQSFLNGLFNSLPPFQRILLRIRNLRDLYPVTGISDPCCFSIFLHDQCFCTGCSQINTHEIAHNSSPIFLLFLFQHRWDLKQALYCRKAFLHRMEIYESKLHFPYRYVPIPQGHLSPDRNDGMYRYPFPDVLFADPSAYNQSVPV